MMNNYQRAVARWLAATGLLYIEEYKIGPYYLDIYLPELQCGIEIDGPHHALRRSKDRTRDATLYRLYGIRVVRLPVGTAKPAALTLVLGDYASTPA